MAEAFVVSEKVGEGGPCEYVCEVSGEMIRERSERGPGIVSGDSRVQDVHSLKYVADSHFWQLWKKIICNLLQAYAEIKNTRECMGLNVYIPA
jgi:hypothetical protein